MRMGGNMSEDDKLPADVIEIVEFLGRWSAGYGYLKWNEIAKFKADLMNVRRRWVGVDRSAFRAKCVEVGLTSQEADELTDYLARAQAGRRLVPQRGYRDSYFAPEPDMDDPVRVRSREPGPVTSRDW